MNNLNFRQGIVSSSNQDWLTLVGTSININASITLNFSERDTDYLYQISSKTSAWNLPDNIGPYWIYWDISKNDASLSYGYTIYNPFEFIDTPSDPPLGQMYYDKNDYVFKEWTGYEWIDVIRLFAGKIEGYILTKQPFGSQTNVYQNCYSDYIVIGTNGLPIKKYDDIGFTFYNKNTILNFNKDQVNSFTYSSITNSNGVCATNITKHKCVTWGDYGKIIYASPTSSPAIALSEIDGVTGDIVSLVFDGFVENRISWNWGDDVNTPLFVGPNGSIIASPSSDDSIQKIGYIVSPNTIFVSFGEQIRKLT